MNGVMYIVLAQLCFAFIGVFTKYIGSAIDSVTLSFFRVLIASVFLLLIAIATGKAKQLSINRKDIVPFFIMGAMFALNFVCFITAFNYTTLLEAGLLCAALPVFVYFMAAKVLKEKISAGGIMALIALIFGIYIMNFTGLDSSHLFGNILVIVSCVFGAGMVTYMRLEDRDHSSMNTTFGAMIFASVLLSPILLWFDFGAVQLGTYTYVIILGVVCTGLAYLLVANALKSVEAGKYSILAIIYFAFISIGFGVWLFGEQFTGSMAVGGSLLMLSALAIHYENYPLANIKFIGILEQRIKMMNK